MRTKLIVIFLLLNVLVLSQTEVVFIQMNDVYEINPLNNGKTGGLSRVASVIKEYEAKNPDTYAILAGDFISPSALSTSEYEGKKINGRQMVDVLNALGLDYVTFGNHEFDYKYPVLQERINESEFTWISSNVKYKDSLDIKPFSKKGDLFPEHVILNVKNKDGKTIKIGILGLCLGSNKQPYVDYEDPFISAKRVYKDIRKNINALIGITHMTIEDDKKLASELPELALIMGGHEHTNMKHQVGNTIITKADANAKTIYIHTLKFDDKGELVNIISELKNIDNTITGDNTVQELADEWTTRAFKGFYDKGFDAHRLVADLGDRTLDGREELVRNVQNELGNLIARAMMSASKDAIMAVFNSGSIRIDDVLTGEITEYDIIRTLPFGGKILQVDIKGDLLLKVLEAGKKNKGAGGFLLYQNAMFTDGEWLVGTFSVKPEKVYNIAISDFLMSGMEKNLEFLNKDNTGIIKIYEPDPGNKADLRNDIRIAVIEYLKNMNK